MRVDGDGEFGNYIIGGLVGAVVGAVTAAINSYDPGTIEIVTNVIDAFVNSDDKVEEKEYVVTIRPSTETVIELRGE